MKLRQASPLFLLFTSAFAASSSDAVPEYADVLTNEQILALNRARVKDSPAREKSSSIRPLVAAQTSTFVGLSRATSTARPFRGTEDAPVDGLDGKPHAGPFVDTTPEDPRGRSNGGVATSATAKSIPTSLEKLANSGASPNGRKLPNIPEKIDGVMNDDNRPLPKKGTTGTEGGVTEKDKARKAQGSLAENIPQEPKEAPPLPHSEDEYMKEVDQLETSDKARYVDKSRSPVLKAEPKDAITGKPIDPPRKSVDFDNGGAFGMEKPTDLPEKPHNIPHPEPQIATQPGSASNKDLEPPVGSLKDTNAGPPPGTDSGNNWLVDTMPDTTDPKTKPKPRPGKSSSSTTSPALSPKSGADPSLEWHEWFHSFVLSFTMIIFSEIGDKTFLVAALMAMRHDRLLVFSAAFGALIAMTVLSAVLGHAFPAFLPVRLTTLAAALLFFVFGARGLREGLAMSPHAGVGDEMREVEAELEEKEHDLESARGRSPASGGDGGSPVPSGRGRRGGGGGGGAGQRGGHAGPRGSAGLVSGVTNLLSLVLSPAWVQTFVMTFLGEWGDRSQIATIAMAAGQDYWWVTLGAILGHGLCTGLAVIGGRALAGRVSMRVVTIGGAVAFLVFGFIYLYECLSE